MNLNKRPKSSAAFIVLALIAFQVACVFPLTVQLAHANSKTILIPDNYATISAAVENAAPGDTILVKRGIYYENVAINKSLSIIGEDAQNTIVIGSGGVPSQSVFNISASNVRVSGFTIESMNYSLTTPSKFATGIGIGGDNCTIDSNNILNVYRGIYVGGWGDLCGGKDSTTIAENNITGTFSDGIRLFGGSMNKIYGNNLIACNASAIAIDGYLNQIYKNNLKANRQGIGVGSQNTVLFGNNITNSINWGIYFEASNTVTAANNITGNRWGIYLSPAFAPGNNTFYHNNFINNTKHVNIGSSYNIQNWDNGVPSSGNYWSNYTGAGEAVFTIDSNNTDHYPITTPYNISPLDSLPAQIQPGYVQADNTAALWHFDEILPNGATLDATGNNPAVLGTATGNVSCPPLANLVTGKYGKALNFEIPQYGWAFGSPSLDAPNEVTLDVWVKVTDYENTTFNNFVVYCTRTLDKYPERVYGLAVNGMNPENATSGPQGALCGYVYTDSGYNEIVTTTPAIALNEWTQVVFTRSLATGMHIYVNGKEQAVRVTYGVQNPTGAIKKGTELNIGHDYIGAIDELRISNVAIAPQSETQSQPTAQNQPIWMDWWFWATITAGVAFLAGIVFLIKRTNKP
jgi:parallel beta-helix repeat protein